MYTVGTIMVAVRPSGHMEARFCRTGMTDETVVRALEKFGSEAYTEAEPRARRDQTNPHYLPEGTPAGSVQRQEKLALGVFDAFTGAGTVFHFSNKVRKKTKPSSTATMKSATIRIAECIEGSYEVTDPRTRNGDNRYYRCSQAG